MSEKFFLGIDGGGTKTEAVIIDENERVRGAGLGGESNYTFVGAEVAAESFRSAIEAALADASISGKEIVAAGCTFGAPAMMVFEGLGIEVRPAGVSEARVAFERAGIEVLRGVSLIAGTGCSCFARGDDGRRAHAGGWGALLGDDGSAYDIGRRGIRQAILAEEGRVPTTLLVHKVCEYFRIETPRHAVGRLAGGGVNQALIAGFAVRVWEAAEEGDKQAAEILESVGEELGEMVAFVVKRVFEPEDEFPIVLAGGVFNAGKWVIDPIGRIIAPQFPRARLVVAKMRPGEAVARLARRDYLGGLTVAD